MIASEIVCEIALVLFWLLIIGETVKAPGLSENAHLHNFSRNDVSSLTQVLHGQRQIYAPVI